MRIVHELTAIEIFTPFAVLVIVAHLTGKANAMNAFWAMTVLLTVAHAVVCWFTIPRIRTASFMLGNLSDRRRLLGNRQMAAAIAASPSDDTARKIK